VLVTSSSQPVEHSSGSLATKGRQLKVTTCRFTMSIPSQNNLKRVSSTSLTSPYIHGYLTSFFIPPLPPESTGVPCIKQDHNRQHNNTIEDIHRPFMLKQIPPLTTPVLNDLENRPNHSQHTDHEQYMQTLFPRHTRIKELRCRRPQHSTIKHKQQ
jgi:hypothetical protein